jgi:hypothetical protein
VGVSEDTTIMQYVTVVRVSLDSLCRNMQHATRCCRKLALRRVQLDRHSTDAMRDGRHMTACDAACMFGLNHCLDDHASIQRAFPSQFCFTYNSRPLIHS